MKIQDAGIKSILHWNVLHIERARPWHLLFEPPPLRQLVSLCLSEQDKADFRTANDLHSLKVSPSSQAAYKFKAFKQSPRHAKVCRRSDSGGIQSKGVSK